MKETIKAFAIKYKTPLIIVGILILIVIIVWASMSGKSNDSKTALAKCLKDKGAKFYGASWCGHCKNQKKMFGDAAKYLPYIECSGGTKECADAKVDGYPTWIFADGKRQSGEIPLAQLKQMVGC